MTETRISQPLKTAASSDKLLDELQNFSPHSINTFFSPRIQDKFQTLNALRNISKAQKSEPITLKDTLGNWKLLVTAYGLIHHPMLGLATASGTIAGARKLNNILRSNEMKHAYITGNKLSSPTYPGPSQSLAYLLSGRPTIHAASSIGQQLGGHPNGNQ